jgi:hypothetical protein
LLRAVCAAAVLCSPTLLGDEPIIEDASQRPTDSAAAKGVFHELTDLRDEIGQNVLEGSLLDGGDSTKGFADGLRSVLGLPAEAHPPAASEPFPIVGNGVVQAIRAESVLLDRLANDLEGSQQYERADQLREIAQRLRVAVRPLDR